MKTIKANLGWKDLTNDKQCVAFEFQIGLVKDYNRLIHNSKGCFTITVKIPAC